MSEVDGMSDDANELETYAEVEQGTYGEENDEDDNVYVDNEADGDGIMYRTETQDTRDTYYQLNAMKNRPQDMDLYNDDDDEEKVEDFNEIEDSEESDSSESFQFSESIQLVKS